jgi:hypothetical protein
MNDIHLAYRSKAVTPLQFVWITEVPDGVLRVPGCSVRDSHVCQSWHDSCSSLVPEISSYVQLSYDVPSLDHANDLRTSRSI